MISKRFLAQLSRNITIGKSGYRETNSGRSFGGINVILCGDLHQFPPVATSPSKALYRPINPAKDSEETQLGRAIYKEFTKVVILKQQMRALDPAWHDFLQHLRFGRVQDSHIEMLRKLVIGSPGSTHVDFGEKEWKNAPLITPRHAVRKHWNDSALQKWCRDTGQQLFICPAQDTIQGRPLTLALLRKERTSHRQLYERERLTQGDQAGQG
jgi:hypothetical protein